MIAVSSGIIAGFVGSRLPAADHSFDDHDHFHDVVYGGDTHEIHAKKILVKVETELSALDSKKN